MIPIILGEQVFNNLMNQTVFLEQPMALPGYAKYLASSNVDY